MYVHTYIPVHHTAVAMQLKQSGFSRKRNDNGEAKVYGPYGLGKLRSDWISAEFIGPVIYRYLPVIWA
jgi:hypothetical protein